MTGNQWFTSDCYYHLILSSLLSIKTRMPVEKRGVKALQVTIIKLHCMDGQNNNCQLYFLPFIILTFNCEKWVSHFNHFVISSMCPNWLVICTNWQAGRTPPYITWYDDNMFCVDSTRSWALSAHFYQISWHLVLPTHISYDDRSNNMDWFSSKHNIMIRVGIVLQNQ